jgi:hypothetical protein
VAGGFPSCDFVRAGNEVLAEEAAVVVVVPAVAAVVEALLNALLNAALVLALPTLRSLGCASSSLDRHDDALSRHGVGLLLIETLPGFPERLASELAEPVVSSCSTELSPPDTSLLRRGPPCTLLAIPIFPYHD